MHEPYKSNDISCKKHLQCKKGVAKQNRIIPGSECMNRLATIRSDTTLQPRLRILNT